MLSIQHLEDAEWVHADDAALDVDNPDFDYVQYLKTWDRKYVPVKDGGTPTVFKIRRLSQRVLEHCLRQPHTPDRDRELVAYSVKSIMDFDGKGGEFPLKREKSQFQGVERLAPSAIESFYSWDLFHELGIVILAFNRLRP